MDNVERLLLEIGHTTKEPASDNFSPMLELLPMDTDSNLQKMEAFLRENETNCLYLVNN